MKMNPKQWCSSVREWICRDKTNDEVIDVKATIGYKTQNGYTPVLE